MSLANPLRYLFILLRALALCVVLLPAPCQAADSPPKSLGTNYCAIYYGSVEDLFDFGRKIGSGPVFPDRDNARALSAIGAAVDGIVYRVRSLLDMYPLEFHFIVRICPTEKALGEAYASAGMLGDPPIAFYVHKSHTIYIFLGKLTAGVLAHEVAHAVINTYFGVPPPSQVQEILSQYVDRHLSDR